MYKAVARPVRFKRDFKLFYDPLRWILKDSLLWKIPFMSPLKQNLVDEIRFYKKEFIVKIDGEFYQYNFEDVRVELRYSTWFKSLKKPGMVLYVFSKSGDELKIVIGKSSTHIGHGTFSKNHRELIYQFAKRSQRFREARDRMYPSLPLLVTTAMALGLVFTL